MVRTGINHGARFILPQVLGKNDLEIAPHVSQVPKQLKPEHRHHFRLWQPSEKNDLSFFEGSFTQMQSLAMRVGQTKEVKRFGSPPTRVYAEPGGVVTVTPISGGKRFQIKAMGAGETILHAENPQGKCQSALFIRVRPTITLRVGFITLIDGHGSEPNGHWNQIETIIDEINKIYLPQVALKVVNVTPRKVTMQIKSDLGKLIKLDQLRSEIVSFEITKALNAHSQNESREEKRQANSRAALISMPRFVFTRMFNDKTYGGLQHGMNLFIRDESNKKRIGRVCAHELAHLLTDQAGNLFDLEGHTTQAKHLLNKTSDGTKISPYSIAEAMYQRAQSLGGRFA